MLFSLLAASMLMVSDRTNFWDEDTVSSKTQIADVDHEGETTFLDDKALQRFQGKRVLIIVHGFDITDPCEFYFDIQDNILGNDSPFDATIGYVWPGFSSHLEYLNAKKNTALAAPKFREFLEKIHRIALRVDVVAHSLGNRLVLDALNENKTRYPLIHNFLSVAPAVEEDSIFKGQIFYLSTELCRNMYVFFSKQDDVLKWIFPFPELSSALGYLGDSNPKKLPKNVQTVDCSAIVNGHDDYLFSKPVYAYVKKVVAHRSPGPLVAQDVAIKIDGQPEILRRR